MTGTPSQVEWAEGMQRHVNREFDRVAASLRAVADKQGGDKRADTEAVIAILEQKRAEVMSRKDAGYFIHDRQEISDQVRQMIFCDPRLSGDQEEQSHRTTLNSVQPPDSPASRKAELAEINCRDCFGVYRARVRSGFTPSNANTRHPIS